MIRIAIDGPGGAGKSTVAKKIAEKLGIIYVDTGALYRTIGLFMLNNGVCPTDAVAVAERLGDFSLELKFIEGKQVILLDGVDVGDAIRTPEASMAASAVSAIKEVREYLLNTQRDIAKKNSVIMDGRDIGTVILPDAEVKVFLTASPEARAKRRYAELCQKGVNTTLEQVASEMAERDKNDSTRDIAPCVPAEDAVLLDNSNLDLDGTAEAIIAIVNEKKKRNKLKDPKSYTFMRALLGGIVRLIFRVKVIGAENIPDEGALICANHIAIRDVFLIAATYPRLIRFIAKKGIFKVPVIGQIVAAWGAIKVERNGGDLAAIRTAVELMEGDNTVAIFPQGHRFPGVNPFTTPRKNGAALIAYRSGCDVLPVCIKVKKNEYAPFRRVEIVYGKLIRNSELGFASGGSAEYEKANEYIFSKIGELGDFKDIPAYDPQNDKKGKK